MIHYTLIYTPTDYAYFNTSQCNDQSHYNQIRYIVLYLFDIKLLGCFLTIHYIGYVLFRLWAGCIVVGKGAYRVVVSFKVVFEDYTVLGGFWCLVEFPLEEVFWFDAEYELPLVEFFLFGYYRWLCIVVCRFGVN